MVERVRSSSGPEFTVNGSVYRSARLDAFEQFDVVRKWASIMIWMAGARQGPNPKFTDEAFVRAFCAVASPVPKEDSDFAIHLCLGTVKRRNQGGAWSPITVNGKLMFDDIDLAAMLKIVYHVLDSNELLDFFVEPPSTSAETPLTPPTAG